MYVNLVFYFIFSLIYLINVDWSLYKIICGKN